MIYSIYFRIRFVNRFLQIIRKFFLSLLYHKRDYGPDGIISILTGASGLIGLESFWIWYVANVFHEISKYPYAYPLAKIAMCLCLILFSAFIILWVISLIRRKKKRLRAVIFSLLFVLTGCGFGYLAITVVTILKDTYLH